MRASSGCRGGWATRPSGRTPLTCSAMLSGCRACAPCRSRRRCERRDSRICLVELTQRGQLALLQLLEVNAEPVENASRHPLSFTRQTEQDVLSANATVTQPPNFIDRERQCSPGTRHPFELLRHRGLAAPDVAFDGFPVFTVVHARAFCRKSADRHLDFQVAPSTRSQFSLPSFFREGSS